MDYAGTSEVGSATTLTEGGTIDGNVTGTLRLTDTQSFTVRTETEADGSTAPTTVEGYFSSTSGTYSGGAAAAANSDVAAVSAVNIGTAAGAKTLSISWMALYAWFLHSAVNWVRLATALTARLTT